jgi:hypothetical protein
METGMDDYTTSTFPGQSIPRDRLDGTGDSSLHRARDLGAEHGKAAAEAWADGWRIAHRTEVLRVSREGRGMWQATCEECGWTGQLVGPDARDAAKRQADSHGNRWEERTLPEPDLSDDTWALLGSEVEDAYCAAFRTARDETIRKAIR